MDQLIRDALKKTSGEYLHKIWQTDSRFYFPDDAPRNYIFIYAIENNLLLPIGPQEANVFAVFLDDEDLESDGNETEFNFRLDEEENTKSRKLFVLWD